MLDLDDRALQPMSTADGRYTLLFNGEIYNYLELRRELQDGGAAFRTSSDSEVLLESFAQWGEQCLHRLRGMFAFLLWDNSTHRLFAARDRFGIKPLYWIQHGNGIAFASEPKQFATLPAWRPRLDATAAFDFLAAGLSDHRRETFFQGVQQLRGGECMWVDGETVRGAPPRIRRWYALPDDAVGPCDGDEAAERLRDLLCDAVRLHLRSDVALGSCLSGGLDSSTLVALAAELGGSLTTVSAVHDDPAVDERHWVRQVADAVKVRSVLVSPSAEDLARQLRTVAYQQDEPFSSTSIFAQWAVFGEARRLGLTVMLDGQGADEPLAGYHSMIAIRQAELARAGRLPQLVAEHTGHARLHNVPVTRQLRAMLPLVLPAAAMRSARHSRLAESVDGVVRPELRDAFGHPVERAGGWGALTDLRAACRAAVESSSLPMLLRFEDRASMAHGIEARVPFLDHPVVEFLLRLPSGHKIASGRTKAVLRDAMRGRLPEPVRERADKLGFATPERAWLCAPEVRPHLAEAIEQAAERFGELLDGTRLRERARGIREGAPPAPGSWRIASLGLWGEVFDVSYEGSAA